MTFTRKQYLDFGQIGLGLAFLILFSRVFISDTSGIELFHNLVWAQSLGCYALSRGRHAAWGLLGFFFGILGFISLIWLQDIPETYEE